MIHSAARVEARHGLGERDSLPISPRTLHSSGSVRIRGNVASFYTLKEAEEAIFLGMESVPHRASGLQLAWEMSTQRPEHWNTYPEQCEPPLKSLRNN